jgi:alpha-tubulin suppressor-like RCC1 family protein
MLRRANSLLARSIPRGSGGGNSGSRFRSSAHRAAAGALLGVAAFTVLAFADSSNSNDSASSGSWFSGLFAPSAPATPVAPLPAPVAAVTEPAPALAPALAPARDERVIFAWGSNEFGQLGPGTTAESEAVPRQLTELDPINPVDLFASADAAMALGPDGALYAWGRGDHYVLGQGTRWELSRVPLRIHGLPPVATAALSTSHAAAVDTDGQVWTWGSRALGRPFTETTAGTPGPVACAAWRGVRATRVACGLNHTLVVMDDGVAYAFGSNSEGALGLGADGNMALTSKSSWSAAAAAHEASTGSAGAGSGARPTLNGNFVSPVRVAGLDGVPIADVAAGKRFSVFLTRDGRVFTCGEDSYGQTGQGLTAARYLYTPRQVEALSGHRVVAISAGDQHAAAVTDDGTVFSWGIGSDGQMGLRSRVMKNSFPLPNTVLRDERGVRAVGAACGGGHTAVLDDAGRLWVMGRGRDGQLGRGDKLESVAAGRDRPMQLDLVMGRYLPPSGGVLKVQLGNNCSYALAHK